ncbi:DUF2845 domain-containing protein [Stutzerimonas stutzeri]|uniref:DUF2845 domain-containing protein n=1 Tax=Stutzerimonas stutzeri TaxID=316 RepID=UPI0004B92DFB|nr:DUF2845 domain-containing protein [Stutzerimonas stutzeri]MCQ4328952.1 DUF2845 domain-containing protein [Stutzerimonas stutzeri]
MLPTSHLLVLSLLVFACNAQASSTHRCGSALVSLEASAAEVKSKCGEPASASLVGYKEVLDDYGFRHEVQVEEWVYGPASGMYHFLRFEGNRLRQIDSQRGR